MTTASDDKLQLFLQLIIDKVITVDAQYTITHTGGRMVHYKLGTRKNSPYVKHLIGNKRYGLACHTIVWMHKHMMCPPPNTHISVKNDDYTDWRYENLELKTGNRVYRTLNDNQHVSKSEKFTNAEVIEYRMKFFNKELTIWDICKAANKDTGHIRKMLYGETYAHISMEPYKEHLTKTAMDTGGLASSTNETKFLSYHLYRKCHVSFYEVAKILNIGYLEVYRNATTYPVAQYAEALRAHVNKYANLPKYLKLYKLYNGDDDDRSIAAQ